MRILEIWARGYASSEGPKILTIEDDQDPNMEAKKAFGPIAVVFANRPKNPPQPTEKFSDEYCRMMSQNDNS